METEAKRHRGRPTKAAAPGDRVTLGLRVTAEMKNRLDEAARRNGRSLSQEAESRLERSFTADDAVDAALGGPIVGGILREVAKAIAWGVRTGSEAATGDRIDGRWLRHRWLYDEAMAAAVAELQTIRDALRPPADTVEPDPTQPKPLPERRRPGEREWRAKLARWFGEDAVERTLGRASSREGRR